MGKLEEASVEKEEASAGLSGGEGGRYRGMVSSWIMSEETVGNVRGRSNANIWEGGVPFDSIYIRVDGSGSSNIHGELRCRLKNRFLLSDRAVTR